MKWLEFEFEGRKVRGAFERVGAELWCHIDGRTFQVETQAFEGRSNRQRQRAASGGKGHEGSIKAPMPGKINKLMVKQGDQVEAGQAVLVMEAMKMEYTLKSKVAGRIEKCTCQLGDQVSLGQVLVEIA